MSDPHVDSLGYWKISVRASEPEEMGCHAIELGAVGTEILGPHALLCYITGSEEDALGLCRSLQELGGIAEAPEPLERRNWVQLCEDIWEPIEAGPFRIVPIIGDRPAPPIIRDTIYVVPGEGFGTGHHPSTRLALSLFDRVARAPEAALRLLDLGTGSGILAIGLAKKFKNFIDAVDNDAAAVRNAAENVELNELSARISIQTATLEPTGPKYGLIAANIYAEVLCELEPLFAERLAPCGSLILAGIMTERASLIAAAFSDRHWKSVDRINESGWVGFLFERR